MEMLVSALLNRIDRVVEEQLARRLPA
jgi:hypothetical protein